jgi:hypothetical protein
LSIMSLDSAYPMAAAVAPPASRGRLTGAAVTAAVVLAIDAVVALAGTLVLALPVFFTATDFESGPGRADTGIAVLTFTAVIALGCPAVAALVAGVRTRTAYVTGVVATATVAVAVAGFAGLWLNLIAGAGFLFAANLTALFLLTGLLRPVPGWQISSI